MELNSGEIITMSDWTMTPILYVISILCLSNVANSSLTQEIKMEIVNLHNTLRRHFAHGQTKEGLFVGNMKKLAWSSALEQKARTTIRLNCTLSFLNVASYSKFTNVAWNSHGNFSHDILSWYNEIRRYSVPDNLCFPIGSCPQAITMLNATQSHIGCAFRRNCLNGHGAFICVYENTNSNEELLWDPIREFHKRGPVCTQCTTPASFCDDGLCTSCDRTTEDCDCRKTCYAPGIGSGQLNNTECSCTCQYGTGRNCDHVCANESSDDFYDYDICEFVTPEECSQYQFVRERCALRCGVCNAFPQA